MSTRLRRWCDVLLEGGWLLAVVLVTLYFNIYTKDSRIFEPQKALILRTLVTLMLAVWAIRTLEEHRSKLQESLWWSKALWGIVLVSIVLSAALFVLRFVTWQDPLLNMVGAVPPPAWLRVLSGLGWGLLTFVLSAGAGLALVGAGYAMRDSWKDALRTAMVIPALAYVAVHVISTIGSVFPQASLYGGYVRQQGTFTVLAYIGLFFILAFNLRRREQVERLVTVILLSSIPSALYGVVQKFGIDPLPWVGDVERRVASTMGNAIFIAAYLILILPLSGYRLLSAWQKLWASPPPDQTPENGRSAIQSSLFVNLLWSGIGLILGVVLVISPIALSIQLTQLRQDPTAAQETINQIWPNYGHNLLVFGGVLLVTVVLPALLYLVLVLIRKRWRPYAHLVALAAVASGAAVLLFIETTRTNGFAWGGYLLGLCVLALLGRWQHLSLPWGEDALWSYAIYILLVLQSLFLFMAIKAYLPNSPYPTKWPLYLFALGAFFASCFLVVGARIRSRVGYLAQLGGYLVLAGLQLTCIFLTQSRGPLTGLLAGMFAFTLIWVWRRQVRWGLIAVVALAVLGGLFLAVFNLPDTPLIGDLVMGNESMASFVNERIEPLKKIPYIGRLGKIFDATSGTGKVRILIWFGDEIGQGSVGMIKSHPLRTLIGFGPEAMHVAYNPYYPPELAHVEKRNASPDRAHDAVIDELVTLGGLGLAGYMFYFVSFFVLAWQLLRRAPDARSQALSAALFSLGVAHFVESLTGIPIVATRMYMWIAIGVAVALTFMQPFREWETDTSPVAEEGEEESVSPPRSRGRRRRSRRSFSRRGIPTGWTVAYVAVALAGLIFAARVHLKPMWADILFWRAKQMEAQSQAYYKQAGQVTDEAMSRRFSEQAAGFAEDGLLSLHRAISLMPEEDFYYLSLAQVYLNGAQLAQTPQDQVAFFESTKSAIARARDISPLNTDHYRNLSALYLAWFSGTRDVDLLRRAIAYNEQAIALTRNNADLRNRLARAYLTAANSGANIQQAVEEQAVAWLQDWDERHQSSGGREGDTHLPIAIQYRQQALDLLQNGNLKRALLVLSAAELQYSLFLDEKYDDTYLLAGDLYRQLDMAAEASVMYGAGVNLTPGLLSDSQAETRIRFVAQADELQPLIAGYEDATVKAEAAVQRWLTQEQPNQVRKAHRQAADAYQALGYIYILQGDAQQAIDYYLSALDHRETLEVHKNLAILYQQIGQIDKAIAHAQKAREIAQKNGQQQEVQTLDSFIQQIQQQQSQLAQAEAHVAANPEDYQAHYNLADLYRDLGRMDDAIREAQLAAQYAPADQPSEVRQMYTRLGNYAFLDNQYELAEEAFLYILQVDEANYNAHYKLGLIYQAWGDLEQALSHAERALELAPDNQLANAQALVDALKQE